MVHNLRNRPFRYFPTYYSSLAGVWDPFLLQHMTCPTCCIPCESHGPGLLVDSRDQKSRHTSAQQGSSAEACEDDEWASCERRRIIQLAGDRRWATARGLVALGTAQRSRSQRSCTMISTLLTTREVCLGRIQCECDSSQSNPWQDSELGNQTLPPARRLIRESSTLAPGGRVMTFEVPCRGMSGKPWTSTRTTSTGHRHVDVLAEKDGIEGGFHDSTRVSYLQARVGGQGNLDLVSSAMHTRGLACRVEVAWILTANLGPVHRPQQSGRSADTS